MVKVKELEATKFEILLKPNSSLTGATRILFLGSIFFICSVIGIGFFIAGGVMILPFAGLEIILVGTCVYLVVKRSYKQEIITLTPEKLKIEKGISKPNQFWEYFRIWAFVVVEKPKHPWYPAHIVITSKGERVPIGDFLTEKEKLDLVDKLRNIIDSLK